LTSRIVAPVMLMVALPGLAASAPPPLRLPEKALMAEQYTFVTTTAKLPPDVRDALARQFDQNPLHMADAGAPFNVGDDILDPSLPGRRLIVAALGPTHAFVHFEQGGVAHTRWIILFEKAPTGLNVLWFGAVDHTYADPKELETAIRTGALWKPARKTQP
jgi:hypothetical protein